MSHWTRRPSVVVNVDGVEIGGENPIVVQSMTNTDTSDVDATGVLLEGIDLGSFDDWVAQRQYQLLMSQVCRSDDLPRYSGWPGMVALYRVDPRPP